MDEPLLVQQGLFFCAAPTLTAPKNGSCEGLVNRAVFVVRCRSLSAARRNLASGAHRLVVVYNGPATVVRSLLRWPKNRTMEIGRIVFRLQPTLVLDWVKY